MTKQITLTEIQKESFGLLYYNLKNSLEILEALKADKRLDGYIKNQFVRIWAAKISMVKTQLDKSLGCNENFDDQIKNSDTQGLSEVIRSYLKLLPEQQQAVEELFKAMNNGEEISMEVA